LVRFWYDVDLLDASELVHLARKAVLAGPFVGGPRGALLRVWIFVVFALEAERLVAPCEFKEAENFLEGFAVDTVRFAFVAVSGADMNLLRHLIQPSGLVTAREPDQGAPFGQLIEPGDFQREPQRVPSGQHVTNRTNLDVLGVMNHMLREHGQATHLDAFAVQ